MFIMIEWFAENFITIIITAVVAAVLALDIIYLIRQHRKGGLCSGCQGCSGCGECGHCGGKDADK